MPLAVRVRPFTEADDDPDEVAFYLPEFGDARGDIEINQDHPLWGEPTRLMREARQSQEFSTGDPRHPIAHELGELAMHQAIGGDRFFPFGEAYLAAEQQFQHEDLAHVYNVVSDRATVNHSEFVAEVFAALLLGREELRADKEIMRMYLEYGGDPGG